MASVQVLILQSGRSDVYGLPLTPGSIVTVDRDYAVSLISTGFASWMNPADAYDGETNIRKTGETYVLYQSGIPFWIPPGDGGANGLSFTGTRGVFTLSAETPLANAYLAFTTGGYCYFPPGTGGLESGGWYWCKMTSSTDGEVFNHTYSGSGEPYFASSPAALPNLAAGRITQGVSEVYGPSVTFPGGSMGPNGSISIMMKWLMSNSASAKNVRARWGGAFFFNTGLTSTNLDQQLRATRFNRGVENAQIGNRTSSGTAAWDGATGATSISGDFSTVDTSVDQTFSFTLNPAANTDSIILWPLLVEVQYGA